MEKDICAAKIGEPNLTQGMRLCGQECEYVSAEQVHRHDGSTYSGWYHTDESITDHHAVPKRWVS